MLDLTGLLATCAIGVHATTMFALVTTESSGNPHAIGVVGGRLERQPASQAEAVATAEQLRKQGRNFSAGLAQVNLANFDRFGLTTRTAFEPCTNLRVAAVILRECYARATRRGRRADDPLGDALSCYYSGGLDRGRQAGYVTRVRNAAGLARSPTPKQEEEADKTVRE